MDEEVFVFKHGTSRFAVSFHTVSIKNYAPPPNGDDFSGRKVMICLFRKALTGQPFSGVAVLRPDEKRKSDEELGKRVALKRAIMAYSSDEFDEIYHSYRLASLRKTNPARWMFIVQREARKKEEERAVEELKVKAEKREERRKRMLEKRANKARKMIEIDPANSKVYSDFVGLVSLLPE